MTPRRVLAVRPDQALSALLADAAGLHDCEIESSTGNTAAMQRLRTRAVDVVISDPSTAIEEDLAFAAEAAAARPSVRVIVLTPQASEAAVVEAIRTNVFACFTAPFDYRDIVSM